MSSYSADFLTSLDPALFESELEFSQSAPQAISHSDDLEALQACIAEDRARKTREGIVIQHRAWNLVDIFRSDGDHISGIAHASESYYWY